LSRLLFRSVKTRPPTVTDFMSYATPGKEPPRHLSHDLDFLHRWAGLSVFETYQQAHQNALSFKWRMGEYIAEIAIPDGVPLNLEGPDQKGHLNLYDADPDVLMQHVVSVRHGPTAIEPN
jgi:hypothetical protein